MTRITDFFTTFTKIRFGRRALRHRGWTEAGPVLSKNEPFRRKIIKIYDYVCKRNLHPTPQRLVRQDGQRPDPQVRKQHRDNIYATESGHVPDRRHDRQD